MAIEERLLCKVPSAKPERARDHDPGRRANAMHAAPAEGEPSQRAARTARAVYHLAGPAAYARDLAIRAMGAKRRLGGQDWISLSALRTETKAAPASTARHRSRRSVDALPDFHRDVRLPFAGQVWARAWLSWHQAWRRSRGSVVACQPLGQFLLAR